MERAVIETFDLLRPDVEPVFVISQSTLVKNYVVEEIVRRGFQTAFFSDTREWPRVARPRSPAHGIDLLRSVTRANLDVIAAARNCDAIYLPGPLYAVHALATILRFRFERRPVLLAHHEITRRHNWLDALVTADIFVSETSRTGPGVVLQHYAGPPRSSDSVPPELRPGPNVVCVSQLTRAKGIDVLLGAWEEVRTVFPGAKLHLLGEGDAVPLPPGVIRWGFREDPGTFLREATILVQPTPPSRCQETWGRSAVEAISAGVPVVCFASGGLCEVVRHEHTGIIVAEESSTALADAMRRYLAEPELRAEHSRNCLADAAERFSAEAIRERWIKFLTELL